jgi:hypothetical protein
VAAALIGGCIGLVIGFVGTIIFGMLSHGEDDY